MESTDSSLKELEKGIGNIRKNSREETGSIIADKWKSDEEEQETAVGVLTSAVGLLTNQNFLLSSKNQKKQNHRGLEVFIIEHIL